MPSSRCRSIPTRSDCSVRSRSSGASAPCRRRSPGRRRIPPIRPPAAASIPAATSRARRAGTARWRCARSAMTTIRRACSRRCSRRPSPEARAEHSPASARAAGQRRHTAGGGARSRGHVPPPRARRPCSRRRRPRVAPGRGARRRRRIRLGKTTLARTLLGLELPSAGELRFEGEVLDRGGTRTLRRKVQMVFQDPYQSLNPRMRVSELVQEPLRMQGMPRGERILRAATALEDAGLAPAERFWHRYPFELSGGQRQRVAIASALAPEPAGLVCDEPVSALDVSVRAQVLHLLLGLRRARGLALLLITHDIGLAWSLCDRVAVMYLGRVVELGTAADVLERPQHPYTQALIAVAPSTRPRPAGRPALLEGEVPDASRLPSGCR